MTTTATPPFYRFRKTAGDSDSDEDCPRPDVKDKSSKALGPIELSRETDRRRHSDAHASNVSPQAPSASGSMHSIHRVNPPGSTAGTPSVPLPVLWPPALPTVPSFNAAAAPPLPAVPSMFFGGIPMAPTASFGGSATYAGPPLPRVPAATTITSSQTSPVKSLSDASWEQRSQSIAQLRQQLGLSDSGSVVPIAAAAPVAAVTAAPPLPSPQDLLNNVQQLTQEWRQGAAPTSYALLAPQAALLGSYSSFSAGSNLRQRSLSRTPSRDGGSVSMYAAGTYHIASRSNSRAPSIERTRSIPVADTPRSASVLRCQQSTSGGIIQASSSINTPSGSYVPNASGIMTSRGPQVISARDGSMTPRGGGAQFPRILSARGPSRQSSASVPRSLSMSVVQGSVGSFRVPPPRIDSFRSLPGGVGGLPVESSSVAPSRSGSITTRTAPVTVALSQAPAVTATGRGAASSSLFTPRGRSPIRQAAPVSACLPLTQLAGSHQLMGPQPASLPFRAPSQHSAPSASFQPPSALRPAGGPLANPSHTTAQQPASGWYPTPSPAPSARGAPGVPPEIAAWTWGASLDDPEEHGASIAADSQMPNLVHL